MALEVTKDKKIALLIIYIFVGTLVGGLIYNPYDPRHYARGAIGVLQGVNIYELNGVVYPPLLYVFSSILFYAISGFTEITTRNYPAIATFVGIGTTTQVFSYILGARLVSDNRTTKWAIASLLNPFVIYVVILFGQMESFIILGIIGVIYSESDDQWEIGGAALAIAASVKIYPAVLFLPYSYHNRENIYRIMRGAIPVGIIIFLLMILYLPESLTIIFSSSGGIRPVNALYIVSLSTVPDWLVSVVFIGSLVIATIISLAMSDNCVRYLIPLVPVVLFYPDVIEYRWLPLAVGALLIGYLPQGPDTKIRHTCKRYGWLWILLGTLAMVVGTIEGWYEGDPWLVPTFGTLPEPPTIFGMWNPGFSFGPLSGNAISAERVILRFIRTGIAAIFIVSIVIWCRTLYIHSYHYNYNDMKVNNGS